jgi:hypothetical protein
MHFQADMPERDIYDEKTENSFIVCTCGGGLSHDAGVGGSNQSSSRTAFRREGRKYDFQINLDSEDKLC